MVYIYNIKSSHQWISSEETHQKRVQLHLGPVYILTEYVLVKIYKISLLCKVKLTLWTDNSVLKVTNQICQSWQCTLNYIKELICQKYQWILSNPVEIGIGHYPLLVVKCHYIKLSIGWGCTTRSPLLQFLIHINLVANVGYFYV